MRLFILELGRYGFFKTDTITIRYIPNIGDNDIDIYKVSFKHAYQKAMTATQTNYAMGGCMKSWPEISYQSKIRHSNVVKELGQNFCNWMIKFIDLKLTRNQESWYVFIISSIYRKNRYEIDRYDIDISTQL